VQKRIEFGVVQALSRAVRWERGRFEFHRDVAPIQARVGFYRPLSVDHVLLEALRVADEREHRGAGLTLSRHAIPRWIPQFEGNVAQLGLTHDEVNAVCLANGQLSLYAISFGLMLPEAEVAAIMQHLVELRLIEIVDARLESELERSLIDVLLHSQHQIQHTGRGSPEQRMLHLANTMVECINGLIDHHTHYARALRGRGEVNPLEVTRYLEATFGPIIAHVQREYPRMDEIIRQREGHIVADDLKTLDRVVRGQELVQCYQDAVLLLWQMLHLVFERVLADEAGQSRPGRQYEDLWATFSREIDIEIARLIGRPAPMRA
jgi:hypothetical protein